MGTADAPWLEIHATPIAFPVPIPGWFRARRPTDFHGHDPEAGDEYWVRYKEQNEGAGNSGSLVAPFTGEHGWYWLNYNDFPVVITLTVAGYFDDIIDYGVHGGLQ